MWEVADFELWSSKVDVAASTLEAPTAGAWRLAPTLELRAYAHDLVSWMEEESIKAPDPRETRVLLWRDLMRFARYDRLGTLELEILKAVRWHGHPATRLGPTMSGSRKSRRRMARDFWASGSLRRGRSFAATASTPEL